MKRYIKYILYNTVLAKYILRLLVTIHQISYTYIGAFASAAECGLHPKHRLMNYHKFFVDNVSEGEGVLDIGCGNGALLRDVALKTRWCVVGVEINKQNVDLAIKRLADLPNIEIVHADIHEYRGQKHFDSIILSNVLEHLDKRAELLRYLKEQFKPKQFLIRVPMFEREWLVPYKKELGVEWRLDTTHEIEYTEEEFRIELTMAGLEIRKIMFKWGEIYAVAVPPS
jgi:SAM-dependent methyltransferase